MIKTINSITEVPIFSGGSTSVLLDIDHTVITPNCFISDPKFRYFRVFDALKKLADEGVVPEDYTKGILGAFRNGRKEVLIEDEWLRFTQKVKDGGCHLLALTSLSTGKYSGMEHVVEEWRYNVLRDLGITFTGHDKIEKLTDDSVDYTINYRGIIQTGKYSKSASLESYFQTIGERPKRIVFFDDRLSKLEEIQKKSAADNIEYQGYLYQGMSHFQFPIYVEERAKRQLDILLKRGVFVQNQDVLEYNQGEEGALIGDTLYNLILEEADKLYL